MKGERAQLAALRVLEEEQKRAGASLSSRVVQKKIANGFAGQRTIKPVRPVKPEVPDAAVYARARQLLLARVAEIVEWKRGIGFFWCLWHPTARKRSGFVPLG